MDATSLQKSKEKQLCKFHSDLNYNHLLVLAIPFALHSSQFINIKPTVQSPAEKQTQYFEFTHTPHRNTSYARGQTPGACSLWPWARRFSITMHSDHFN
jgi:hypothetical protein